MPTRIVIPSIGLDAVVARGVDEGALRIGPGHDPASALPGQKGNCVIAAHRNVYGSWFARINDLRSGSKIELRTPDGSYEYLVLGISTVSESDYTVLQPPPHGQAPPRLTLITCTAPHSAYRVIVTAEMMVE